MKPEEASFISQALRVIGVAVVHVIGHDRSACAHLAAAAQAGEPGAVQAAGAGTNAPQGDHSDGARHARAGAVCAETPPTCSCDCRAIKTILPTCSETPEERAPLMPPYRGGGCSDVDFASLPKGKPRKPVPVYKLVARIALLQRVLENPEPSARRLTIHYARLKKLDTSPSPPPEIPFRRAHAELALVAGALPIELTRALKLWHDSG